MHCRLFGRGNRAGRAVLLTGLVFFFSAGLLVTPAGAADESAPSDTLPALQADLKVYKKTKDVSSLVRACNRASILYDDVTTDKQRKLLVDIVGKMPSIKKDEDVVHASLDALGEMADPKGAKYIKRYLKIVKKDKASKTLKLAIRTAAKVPEKSLVGPLLRIFQTTKVVSAQRMAAQSLANFRSVKKYRAKILETLISEVKKVKPGGPGRMSGGGGPGGVDPTYGGGLGTGTGGYGEPSGPTAVWSALAPILPSLLNKFTGQSLSSLDDWFGVYNQNKSKPQVLFIDE